MVNRGNLSNATVFGIDMIETVKASGAEDAYFARWAGIHAREVNANLQFLKLDQMLGVIPGLIQALAGGAVLITGAYFIMQGDFTVGALLAFQGFATSMMSPFTSLIGIGQQIQEMRTSMERVEDVTLYKPDVLASFESSEGDKSKLRGNLEIKNLTFGYNRLEKPFVKHFSLSIPAGSKGAILGVG